jgi:SRSO17 transposase
VVRQYCGQRGKQDNCQVAVTLSVAADHASPPIAHRLYLPQVWADDQQRCVRTGVPQDVAFQTKSQIAFAQIRAALAAGSGAARCRTQPVATGRRLLPQKPWSGRGRRPLLLRRDDTHKPVSARQVAFDLPKRTWRGVTWREGSIAPLACRFAAVQVRPGRRDYWRSTPRRAEWLLIEWPAGEAEPTRY